MYNFIKLYTKLYTKPYIMHTFDFNYKEKPYQEKITELLDHMGSSTQLAQSLQVTRMTLLSWQDTTNAPVIRQHNKDAIDYLWCKKILIPSIDSRDYIATSHDIVDTKNITDVLSQQVLFDSFIKKNTFGSLEIETQIIQDEFDLIVDKNKIPVGSDVIKVLEVINIYNLHKDILNNYIDNALSPITPKSITNWHKQLMQGILDTAGEFSNKIRAIKGVEDIHLTLPEDICEEVQYWCDRYREINTISDIASAHSHFELIHPFSDGNGRIGRAIMIQQSLQANIMPPIINASNKEIYYAALEYSQKYNKHNPLAAFLQHSSIAVSQALSQKTTQKSNLKMRF